MDPKDFNTLLAEAAKLKVALSDEQAQAMGTFMGLVQEWNRVYNLTAITDPQTAIQAHLLDSLSVGPYLEGKTFLDVGTGAGFPGIPLAIAYPKTHWVLVDKSQKKIRFLNHAVMVLGLKARVIACHTRVEDLNAPPYFDAVISRAFSEWLLFFQQTAHLLAEGGHFYAMKGVWPETTADGSAENSHPVYYIDQVIPLRVPGCSHRHLVVGSPRGAS